ncbi:MAG: prepilin peptidase [Candidatus Peribacteraceae bacterium]|nr:prepilin peptidase [Candidatus Peribacteraceae bacterium]MDD5741837.1 prepilin peptidase [Candidatus Peribacteraceae bacterium]
MLSSNISLIVLFAVLGLVFGSFGTVIISRVPAGRHLGGRSRCPRCTHVLGAVELVPLFSYLLLRGRCRHCSRSISVFYPLLELASALLFVLAFFIGSTPLPSLLLAFSLWLLLLIAVIDARTQTIHDALNVSFLLFSVAYVVVLGRLHMAGPLLFIFFFGVQWLLSRGRWVGSGDILLGAGIGFLLGGWEKALLCLGLAYMLGAAAAIFLLATKRATRKSRIPFGPFLAIATLLMVVAGNEMLRMLVPGLL